MERRGDVARNDNFPTIEKMDYELLRDKRVAKLAIAFQPIQHALKEL
jgi:hypothetical protein